MRGLPALRHAKDDDEASAREAYRPRLHARNRRRDGGAREIFEPPQLALGASGQGGEARRDAAFSADADEQMAAAAIGQRRDLLDERMLECGGQEGDVSVAPQPLADGGGEVGLAEGVKVDVAERHA